MRIINPWENLEHTLDYVRIRGAYSVLPLFALFMLLNIISLRYMCFHMGFEIIE